MISVGELRNYVEYIEREWGSDAKVCIQARDEYCKQIGGGYCDGIWHKKDGTLFLTGEIRMEESND